MKLQRMCAVCREVKGKDSFVRIVKQKESISVDLSGKLAGRGTYICKDGGCIEKARKVRAIERSLSCKVETDVYDALEAMQDGRE